MGQTLLHSRQNRNDADHQTENEIDGDKELVDAATGALKIQISLKNMIK